MLALALAPACAGTERQPQPVLHEVTPAAPAPTPTAANEEPKADEPAAEPAAAANAASANTMVIEITQIPGLSVRAPAGWVLAPTPPQLFRYALSRASPSCELIISVIAAGSAEAALRALDDVAGERSVPVDRAAIAGQPAVLLHYEGALEPSMKRVRHTTAAIVFDAQLLRFQGFCGLEAGSEDALTAIIRSALRAR